MVVSHDELGVHQDIATEDEGRHHTIDQLHRAAMRKERSHEAEDDEHPQRAEKIGHPAREVVFGLASEEGQGDEDAEREDERLDHNSRFIEGCDDADGVGFEEGESAQKN